MDKKVESVISKLSAQAKKQLKKASMPQWIDPMLATLTKNYFSDKNYIYEHKWDGIRIVAYKKADEVRLMTRNKINATKNYPDIVKNLKKYDFDFIIDGELVAIKDHKSDFGLLQQQMHKENKGTSSDITYEVFDLMYIDDYDITKLQLLDRKFILQNVFSSKKPVHLTEHISENGLEYFKQACAKGWEGLIVKEIHDTYEAGIRSKKWLKFKCGEEQELVIGGFTKPHGQRLDFGALLLGYYDNGKLIYAGKVGTGFSFDMLKELGAKLEKLKTNKSPFESADISLKDVYWVKPVLVAQIKFSEWTSYNKLRHGRFLGLRNDKDAKDVVKEKPARIEI